MFLCFPYFGTNTDTLSSFNSPNKVLPLSVVVITTGSIPKEIGNLKRLEKLSIMVANLVGNIPESIFNMSSLRFFDFSNNSLSGVLSPDLYINLPNLEGLHIFSNHFTGQIPHGFWKLQRIQRLVVSLNNFIGSIPPEIGNLTSLTNLFLGRNHFTGMFNNSKFT